MVKSTIIRPTGLTMDVTPTPAILGLMENLQIEPWRCVAELVDNSLDDFQSNHSAQGVVDVDVLDKSLTVTDNGGGMSFDQLRDALRAGYSSKTKNSELGLFGIGFNLATAKLGRKATVITKKSNDKTWLQVEIDLNKLTKQNDFRLQPQQVSIDGGPDHGTIVSVDLSREHLKQFERNSYLNQIRNSLGRTYSYILRNSVQGLTGLASGNPRSVIVNVAGSAVEPFLPCIWDENRTVVYR